MNINWGSLEHLELINDRIEKDQTILAEEKAVILQIFYGYVKVKGGRI
jgi:hypothetical protein